MTVGRQRAGGFVWHVRADRTLYLPDRQTLFAADIHLGKDTAFRALGVPIPPGSTQATLSRLGQSVRDSGCRRLVLLGDLWHDRRSHTAETRDQFRTWRDALADIDIWLVEGNHDLRSGTLDPQLNVHVVPDPTEEEGLVFRHYPGESPVGYGLAGHLHPSVALEGPGRQSMRLPCFWFGPEQVVLPAFGEFTGCAAVRPLAGDAVWVLTDQAPIQVQGDGQVDPSLAVPHAN